MLDRGGKELPLVGKFERVGLELMLDVVGLDGMQVVVVK
jgi:hypothetical protein